MNKDPERFCFVTHGSNETLDYHKCMCAFNYAYTRGKVKSLKIKHCLEEARIYKMTNFYTYIVIAAVLLVICVSVIAAFCSLKWYMETKNNPCKCYSFFCCCNKTKKRKRRHTNENGTPDVIDSFGNGHVQGNIIPDSPEPSRKGICMKFCMSEPVQDCCQFLDCDIFWRRGTAYAMPSVGMKKPNHEQQMFHRRPSRPAPPPPKAIVYPQMKYPEPTVEDECEPVPEAPPSPEPVRVLSPRSLYVDPLAFLQKPFLKSPDKDDLEEKQEPLYSKFKNMVMSRVRKSPSISAVNHVGLPDTNGSISLSPDGANYNSMNLRTGSLASLHNIGDPDESVSSGSKRSLSLASLHMLDIRNFMPNFNPSLDPRSRISVVSTATTDDIPPSARKDEYIDLEEMSKTMAAKRRKAEQANICDPQNLTQQALYVTHQMINNELHTRPQSKINDDYNITIPKTYTPNFIPASAFPKPMLIGNFGVEPITLSPPVQHYYPPVPASAGRPAVPARTGGTPIYAISPANTLIKQKPIVPPRPAGIDGGRNSPKAQTLTRSPRIIKPAGPPPPPPQYTSHVVPMESSI